MFRNASCPLPEDQDERKNLLNLEFSDEAELSELVKFSTNLKWTGSVLVFERLDSRWPSQDWRRRLPFARRPESDQVAGAICSFNQMSAQETYLRRETDLAIVPNLASNSLICLRKMPSGGASFTTFTLTSPEDATNSIF